MSDDRICPVCQGDMEDQRHVGVECFYDVHEVAPMATKRRIFFEVDDKASVWGLTRRYPAGTEDKHRVVPTGEHSSRIETDQVPVPAIRLCNVTIYDVTCCKSCRGEFLNMFGQWARGKLRERRQDDDEANIPVRVNGATVMMTRAEFDAHRSQSD